MMTFDSAQEVFKSKARLCAALSRFDESARSPANVETRGSRDAKASAQRRCRRALLEAHWVSFGGLGFRVYGLGTTPTLFQDLHRAATRAEPHPAQKPDRVTPRCYLDVHKPF